MRNNKRVLIINNYSIFENNSTGLTLRSIVDFFEREELMEVYYFPMAIGSIQSNFESVRLKTKTKRIYNFIARFYKGSFKKNIARRIIEDEIQEQFGLFQRIKNVILALDDWISPNIRCNRLTLKRVEDFDPEVIYTLGASIFSLKLSYFFSMKYDIPIVLHHMDNWRETAYTSTKIFKLPRMKLINELKNVESRMNFGMTISDEMAKIYESQTNKRYFSLMHTVDNSKYNHEVHRMVSGINLVYAGGLHLGRWKVLKEIERAIGELNTTTTNVNLIIFTSNTDRENFECQFSKSVVEFHDYLPHSEVYKIYVMSDILVHVESFDAKIIDFTKYSLSTKIPEYMSFGRPILCYAPQKLASSKYIMSTESGVSVSNYKELVLELEKLINEESLRVKLGMNGIKTARTRHSNIYKEKIMRTVFELD